MSIKSSTETTINYEITKYLIIKKLLIIQKQPQPKKFRAMINSNIKLCYLHDNGL